MFFQDATPTVSLCVALPFYLFFCFFLFFFSGSTLPVKRTEPNKKGKIRCKNQVRVFNKQYTR